MRIMGKLYCRRTAIAKLVDHNILTIFEGVPDIRRMEASRAVVVELLDTRNANILTGCQTRLVGHVEAQAFEDVGKMWRDFKYDLIGEDVDTCM